MFILEKKNSQINNLSFQHKKIEKEGQNKQRARCRKRTIKLRAGIKHWKQPNKRGNETKSFGFFWKDKIDKLLERLTKIKGRYKLPVL